MPTFHGSATTTEALPSYNFMGLESPKPRCNRCSNDATASTKVGTREVHYCGNHVPAEVTRFQHAAHAVMLRGFHRGKAARRRP
jgi:hypothetical protein